MSAVEMQDHQMAELLRIIQGSFPMSVRPYRDIGHLSGLSEQEVITRIQELKEKKLIRQISPIFDTRALGYDSALVAMRVEPEKLESAADQVSAHPGVSHNYERSHLFNLWFTLAISPDSEKKLEQVVAQFVDESGASDHAILRSTRVFKIGVKLDSASSGLEQEDPDVSPVQARPLTELEKKTVRITQSDLPLVKEPFLNYAEQLGVSQERLLEILHLLKNDGIMRRFAGILFHRKAGFSANGMAVWRVDADRSEAIGTQMARFRGVSHCYERTVSPHWPYRLFSMIHGKSREEVEAIARAMSQETGVVDYKILYSVREFKKKRVRYFEEALSSSSNEKADLGSMHRQ